MRVSNELGAGNPKAAKFSISVNVLTSAVIGLIFSATILATRKEFPRLFTNEQHVIKETSKLGYILAAIIFLNGIQPVLLGMFCSLSRYIKTQISHRSRLNKMKLGRVWMRKGHSNK